LDLALDLIGKTLGSRYLVRSRLGEGGMGSVYLADDQNLPHQVVVKIPHTLFLSDASFLERFLSEVRNLALNQHPHVIKILDSGEFEGVPYAVVQYVGGGDLRERVPRGSRQSPEEILSWLPDIADALDFMHGRGFLHRDVKPSNIFFDDAGNAYLSDFGIATAIKSARSDGAAATLPVLTTVGTFVGSPSYAPPEAIHRRLAPAYDQYSLAVTVYDLLSGQVPFQGETSEAVMHAKASHPAPALSDLVPDLPRAAARAVMRALSIDPGDRFCSCQEFVRAFEEGLDTGAAGAGRKGRGRRLALAAVAVGLLAGALALRNLWEAGAAPETSSAPVRFQAGSSPEEMDRALALCRRYSGRCDPESYASEHLREEWISPIQLDRHEITNADFAAFAERTGYRSTAEARGFSFHQLARAEGWSWRRPAGPGSSHSPSPAHPVVHVSLRDAEAYCRERGRRLPTEAEWEFVARGDERRLFPWGDAFDEAAVGWSQRGQGPQPVGSHPAGSTPGGHRDMAGSVWEWTSSTREGMAVLKGGSWLEVDPASLRAATQLLEDSDYSSSDIGFRCVRELAAWPQR
jgi:formylglycine-generating enzyme required for sulfatase activity